MSRINKIRQTQLAAKGLFKSEKPEPASSDNSDLLLRSTAIEFNGQDFHLKGKPEMILVLYNIETGSYMSPPLEVAQ